MGNISPYRTEWIQDRTAHFVHCTQNVITSELLFSRLIANTINFCWQKVK